ncbi:hypothetical protein TRFO_20437 [Tritrichomonas foetus]|uniref:SMP-LTD domain-containing protein n=1 Tax=Tritrichomonas foetus TaxID=1144522 RepID=A0A1J4KH60_9EUKA|nr:hypothetical protein TRFO_20437 [Tritrichomonas foetus]|eukprot:OHT10378.1 hypothetical protein TRFO_20437 [Tritrichomonas foetus]
MDYFLYGFTISFTIVIIALLILRVIISHIPRILGSKPLTYQSVTESTEWLNFIINRVTTHYQSENSIQEINNFITAKVHPIQFHLLSIGNPPVISHVATLEMQEADDIRLLVPIEWRNGPSFDIIGYKQFLNLEIDLLNFTGEILVSWPGSSQNRLEIQFMSGSSIDFDLSIQFLNILHFSVTNIPLIGEIVKGLVACIIAKQVFPVYLPKQPINSEANPPEFF